MRFQSIFIAIFVGTSLMVGALILNSVRPAADTNRATATEVAATGECAQCHRDVTPGVVHQYESSVHSAAAITCLDCHSAAAGQTAMDHNGFQIVANITSQNCANCHAAQYDQFLHSRHALPASAAVAGTAGMTPEMIAMGESYHPGAVNRPANALALLEGESAIESGCMGCHSIGAPNADGSVGDCAQCHTRHSTSIELVRRPETCGQCHMGPDHSQLEIYSESKHGTLFAAQQEWMNLNAAPSELTTRDMPVPTCATCHMSGLEDSEVTHDTTQRLSYWLFDSVSKRRPGYEQGRDAMQQICRNCHAQSSIDRLYTQAEAVVESTNEWVSKAEAVIEDLRADNLLTPAPFDEPIEFAYFDYWHYFGRTSKHGAFMDGADFVQWHGNYELKSRLVELQKMAEEIRKAAGR